MSSRINWFKWVLIWLEGIKNFQLKWSWDYTLSPGVLHWLSLLDALWVKIVHSKPLQRYWTWPVQYSHLFTVTICHVSPLNPINPNCWDLNRMQRKARGGEHEIYLSNQGAFTLSIKAPPIKAGLSIFCPWSEYVLLAWAKQTLSKFLSSCDCLAKGNHFKSLGNGLMFFTSLSLYSQRYRNKGWWHLASRSLFIWERGGQDIALEGRHSRTALEAP